MNSNSFSKNIVRALALGLFAVMTATSIGCASMGSQPVSLKAPLDNRVVRQSERADLPEHHRG